MRKFCIYLRVYILLVAVTIVTSLKISEKHASMSVQYGSPGVILDCPYELKEGDAKGLVIKWFYENDATAIFQWIPMEHKLPQDLGFLKGKLDVSHVVTTDEYSKHRALYIKEPTPDLNGVYKCYVSNFLEEDIAEIQLTVYIPPTNFTIDYYEEEEDVVTFICQADGVYPEPCIELYYEEVDGPEKIIIMHSEVSIVLDNDTETYNVTTQKTFSNEDLNTSNSVGCALKLNGTDYNLNVGLTYYTGPFPSVSPSPDNTDPTADEFTEENKMEDIIISFGSSASTIANTDDILVLILSWCFVFLKS